MLHRLHCLATILAAAIVPGCSLGHLVGDAARDVSTWMAGDHYGKVIRVEEEVLDHTDNGDEYYLLSQVVEAPRDHRSPETWRLRVRKLCRLQARLLPRRTAAFARQWPAALRSYTLSQRSPNPREQTAGVVEYDAFMYGFAQNQQDVAWFSKMRDEGVHSFEWELEGTGLDETHPLLASPLDVESIRLWRDERSLRSSTR